MATFAFPLFPTPTPQHQNYNAVGLQGEPVSTADGTLFFNVADFSYARPGFKLEFVRTYNARLTSVLGSLGHHWMSNYDHYIYLGDSSALSVKWFVPNRSFDFSRSSDAAPFTSPPGSFADLSEIPTGTVPEELAGHPVLMDAALSPQRLLLLTDKTGKRTYYASFLPGPANICKPLLQVDLEGNRLVYSYETFTRQIGNDQSATIDTRLRAVEAGPVFQWDLAFEYYSGPAESGEGTIDQLLYRVSSSIGDLIEFSQPGLVTSVKRGTIFLPDSGYPATYQYEVNAEGFRVLVKKDDPLSARGDKHTGYGYQRSGGTIVGGVNEIFNGRLQSQIKMEFPYPPMPVATFTAVVKNGSDIVQKIDTYDPTGIAPVLVQDLLHIDSSTAYQTYQRNPDGLVTVLRDGRGNFVYMTYDDDGNLLTRRTADSAASEIFTYGPFSRLRTYTDKKGNLTELVYSDDGKHRLLEIRQPLGKRTGFSYYSNGLLASLTEWVSASKSQVTSFTYDGNGNLTSIREPDPTLPVGTAPAGVPSTGPITGYNFDPRSRLYSATDPMGQTTTQIWNEKNQLESVYHPDGTEDRFEYDSNGNVGLHRDRNGTVAKFAHDADDNLTDIWEAIGTADATHTKLTYDEQNNRTRIVRDFGGLSHTTDQVFNQQNRVRTRTDSTVQTHFTYDGNLNVSTRRDLRQTTTYSYDLANRLEGISGSDGTTISYTYDANGNRESMTDAEGLKTYTYDELNRLLTTTNHALGVVISHTSYDLLGRRLGLLLSRAASGLSLSYSYSYYENGQLKTQTDPDGETTTYWYDPMRSPLRVERPSGVARTDYEYYLRTHRLKSVVNINSTGEVLSRFEHREYDAAGNLEAIEDMTGLSTFEYDKRNQLVEAARPGGLGVINYVYDKVGNRTLAGSSNATYGTSDQILSNGPISFAHDSSGNIQSKGTQVFRWDAMNRLSEVLGAGGSASIASYVYNGDNIRVRKTDGVGAVTNYIYDGLQVLAEMDGSGTVRKLYNPGISITDDMGNKFFYLHDGRGNVASLIDKDGNIVQSYSYDAFGALTGGMDKSNGYRFVARGGVYSDDEVGLQYMWNRWYDPELGRFISRDPIGFAGGFNLYSYVGSNPLRWADPFGLFYDPMDEVYGDGSYNQGIAEVEREFVTGMTTYIVGVQTIPLTAAGVAYSGLGIYSAGSALVAGTGSVALNYAGLLGSSFGFVEGTTNLLGSQFSPEVSLAGNGFSLGVDLYNRDVIGVMFDVISLMGTTQPMFGHAGNMCP
jgi:RHS repeat-associated protein